MPALLFYCPFVYYIYLQYTNTVFITVFDLVFVFLFVNCGVKAFCVVTILAPLGVSFTTGFILVLLMALCYY